MCDLRYGGHFGRVTDGGREGGSNEGSRGGGREGSEEESIRGGRRLQHYSETWILFSFSELVQPPGFNSKKIHSIYITELE